MMKKLLLQIPDYLLNSENKEAVLRHAEVFKDAIKSNAVKDKDLNLLSQGLRLLCHGTSQWRRPS